MNRYDIEAAADGGPLTLNADYTFEFTDVTDGDFYLAAILDSMTTATRNTSGFTAPRAPPNPKRLG
jgi:hypothetical protein